ncbi:MAG: hypothetical protein KIT84_14590 [Labilithrix sp.]|nr:hypothetical protein [Labilithrix sp.]MCW5812250.1 hypothetical protein [Labilithrix sp.]
MSRLAVLLTVLITVACSSSDDPGTAGSGNADAGAEQADATATPDAAGSAGNTDAGTSSDAGGDPAPPGDNKAFVRIDTSARDGYEQARVIESFWTLGGTDDLAQQSVLFQTEPREMELRLTFLPKASGSYVCGTNPTPGSGQAPRVQLQRTIAPLSQFRARDATGACAIELTVTGTTYSGTFTATLVDSAGPDTIAISGSFRFTGESGS